MDQMCLVLISEIGSIATRVIWFVILVVRLVRTMYRRFCVSDNVATA